MSYPITPDYISRLPQGTEKAMLALEDFLLRDIAERLAMHGGEITATAREHILMLQRTGYDMTRVARTLSQMTGIAEKEVRAAMLQMLQDAGYHYTALYQACGSIIDPTQALAADIDAITRATELEMKNISRSLGFSLRGPHGVQQWYSPADAYQRVLDEALIRVNQGLSYNDSIRSAVRQLADSGIHTVTYDKADATGHITTHTNRADVAARRALMTGVTKVSQAYADRAAYDLHTPYVEVTAHAGARDVDKPNPWSNHRAWQGKVYSKRDGDKYPSVYTVCGLGEVDGLCGPNCRHTYSPFIPGVMERTYTDEELKNIDRPPFEYNGRRYTQYQASQLMRRAETELRACKRRMIAASASGDRDAYTTAAARYRTVKAEYSAFADKAGLRNQMYDRAYVWEWGPKEEKAAEEALQAAKP